MFSKLFKNKKKIDHFLEDDNDPYVFEFNNFNLWNEHKTKHILKNINLKIKKNTIVAIIGPSGSGKSSLLRCINKSNFENQNYVADGEIMYKKINILDNVFPVEILRTQIGLVFQKPICFPMSIKENVLFAIKAHGIYDENYLNTKLERLLRNCFLWDELKDRLNERPENTLSGGQQQRLCIARAIALQPLVLLMDEPTSSLDLKSNNKIEELILKISKTTTVILVSHSFTQIKRISEYTIFLKDGEVVEYDLTRKIFTNPKSNITKDFVSGKY